LQSNDGGDKQEAMIIVSGKVERYRIEQTTQKRTKVCERMGRGSLHYGRSERGDSGREYQSQTEKTGVNLKNR